MPKAILALIVALLLSVYAAFWGWSEASAARGVAKEQIELREAAEARLKRIQATVSALEKKNAESRTRLERTLRDVPDRPTPRPVYDSLCARANCAKLDTVQSPSD